MAQGRLKGKVVLITGGGSGIGAAVAKVFCAEGVAVFWVDADVNGLDKTCHPIQESQPGTRALSYRANVPDLDLAGQAVSDCAGAFGGLDVLVNNASMRSHVMASQASEAKWLEIVSVDLAGITHDCHASLPYLREKGHGSIVNVSPCCALKARKGMPLYDATKAAQISLTRSLAFEEAEHGVRVNAVSPGSTLTDFHLERAREIGKSVEQLKTERKDTALPGRCATPEEIAWPVLWLASSEASFITGTNLVVDGGLHIK
jgi:meso-butanediol dehydrogenase/(S,S)-butanediol dehydrogenase/diacetyl reductase